MLMSAMVKLDVHSFRNRFLWEILGNAQYLTSSQGHCVIPSNISFWSKRRSQLSQRVNLERAQGRETQMGKSSDPQHLWETDEGGHGDFSQKAGVFRVAISILSTMAAKFHFPPLMGKAKENYETRWELDIWGSHVYKFSCGGKRWRRGRKLLSLQRRTALLASRGWLSNRWFLEYKKKP